MIPQRMHLVPTSLLATSLALLSSSAAAQVQGDFNGDGYADLAIAAPKALIAGQLDAGSVTVLFGNALGVYPLATPPQFLSQDGLQLHPDTGDQFGTAMATGDFDGDGFSDLAIGVPGEYSPTSGLIEVGVVHVLYGSVSGLSEHGLPYLIQGGPSGVIGTAGPLNRFGSALSAGDYNGDGYDDLAIGAPGEAVGSFTGAGTVTVLHGWFTGLMNGPTADSVWTQNSPGVHGGSETDDGFGSVLESGDFNGDGYADLAVGIPNEGLNGLTEVGMMQVLYGSTNSIDPVAIPAKRWHQNTPGVGGIIEAGDHFGAALTAGDFNGDGIDDLAIGSPGEDLLGAVDGGAVQTLVGTTTELTSTGGLSLNQTHFGVTPNSFDVFGSALTAGDATGDGFDELFIGSPGETTDAPGGAMHVALGSAAGVVAIPSAFQATASIPHFGYAQSLAMGDYDGNGLMDVAIGVPGMLVFGGAVQVLSLTFNDSVIQNLPGLPPATVLPSDEFGAAFN